MAGIESWLRNTQQVLPMNESADANKAALITHRAGLNAINPTPRASGDGGSAKWRATISATKAVISAAVNQNASRMAERSFQNGSLRARRQKATRTASGTIAK